MNNGSIYTCTCERCRSTIEVDLATEVDGRMLCKECVTNFIMSTSTATHAAIPKRRISKLLLFMFSIAMPGANYMYLGLMKKGVFTMALFFFLVAILTQVHSFGAVLFSGATVILYFYSFFDAFEQRRRKMYS